MNSLPPEARRLLKEAKAITRDFWWQRNWIWVALGAGAGLAILTGAALYLVTRNIDVVM